MIPTVRTQWTVTPLPFEDVDTQDLPVLDTTSLTKVDAFIRKFEADKTFTPPEAGNMVFDSAIAPIDIDNDNAPEFAEDFDDVLNK